MLVHLTLGWAWNWALEIELVPDAPISMGSLRCSILGCCALAVVLTPCREGASTGEGSISGPRFALLCKLFCSVPEGTRVGIKH